MKLAETPSQPESGDNGLIGKCMVLDVKEGGLEGKSKEISTMVANRIIEELTESTLEMTLDEMLDGSTPEFHAIEIPSQTSTDIIRPTSAVQIIDDDTDGKAPSMATSCMMGQGHYGNGKLFAYKNINESLYFKEWHQSPVVYSRDKQIQACKDKERGTEKRKVLIWEHWWL